MKTSNLQQGRAHHEAIIRGWVSPWRAGSGITGITVDGGTVTDNGDGTVTITIGSGDGSGVGGGVVDGVGTSVGSVVTMLNNSGADLAPGSVVVVDETADRAVTTTTTVGDTRIAGVVQAIVPNGVTGPVLFNGLSGGVITTGAIPRGYYLRTSATAGAAEATAARSSGSFAVLDTSNVFPAEAFVRNQRTTESAGAVTSLAIDVPSADTNRVLFLALWRDPSVTTAVTLTGWTRIGSTSGFWYYYRVTTGTDPASASWSTVSPAVAIVALLSELVDADSIVAASAYDATTAAAAVSGMSAVARYAIAAVADDPATPATWDAIAGGISTGTGTGSDQNLATGTVTGGGTNATVNNPTNANDGNAATLSQGPSGATGSSPVEQWWIADLGAAYSIGSFTVKYVNGDLLNWLTNTPLTAGQISARFQYSTVGTSGPWTDLSTSVTANDGNSPVTISWEWPSAVSARYWRIFKEGKYNTNFFDGLDVYTWAINAGASLEAVGRLVGQYIESATAATSPYTGASAQSDAIFAINLTTGALASCLLYGPDLGASGSGGAPTTVNYLVGTADAGLSAEIVVGTTPGGELGGTWASPTVDATHSGSAHLALSASTPLIESGAGSAGSGTAASKNDHVHPALSGTGAVATDTIWDAAGDLAVGTGADTAAKLALGAAGGAVSRVNGAVAWNSGTSFPTAATGDRYWRTDRGMEFYYDGTRWLSVTLHQMPVSQSDVLNGYTAGPGTQRAPVPVWGGSDVYLVSAQTWFYVVAGTALSASHKWVGTFTKQPAGVTLDTVNIDSGASDTYRQSTATAINALLGTTNFLFIMSWAKTGTPGTLYTQTVVSFRYVST